MEIKVLKFVASVLLVIAGSMIALKLPHFEYAFAIFFAGHSIMNYVFIKTKEHSLLMANLFFWVLDAIGIYRWLL